MVPPFLIAQRGPAIGRRYDLTTPQFTIGRGEDNDLVLNDAMVSRYHAVIRQESAGGVVIDLGSTNPVLVNDVPLEPGVPQRLEHRDVVVIGAAVLSYQTGSPFIAPRLPSAPTEPRTMVAGLSGGGPSPATSEESSRLVPVLPQEAPVQPPPRDSAAPPSAAWLPEPPPLEPVTRTPPAPQPVQEAGTVGRAQPEVDALRSAPARPAEPLPDDETPTVIRQRPPDE